jgi:hypothetical protein
MFEFQPSGALTGFDDGYGNRVHGGGCDWLYKPIWTDSANFGSNFFVATDRGDSFRSNSHEKAASTKLGCQRFTQPQILSANMNDAVSDFAIQSVFLYNRRLSDSDVASVEAWLTPQIACPAGKQFSAEFFGCIKCPKGTYKSNSNTWSPSELPSLKLWLDASDASTITASNGIVSEWRDKSGNAFHAAQTVAPKRPRYANSSITFPASTYLFGNMPSQTFPSGLQVTVVLKHEVMASASAAFPFTRCQGDIPAPFDYFNSNVRTGNGIAQKYSSAKFVNVGSLQRTTIVSMQIKENFLRQFVNGYDVKSLTGNSLSTTGTGIVDAAAKYFIATRADEGTQFLGDVYEVIVTPVLSFDNRRALEIYLATKWNVLDYFSATPACTPCPGGTFTMNEGAVSSSECIGVSCPVGQQYSYAKSACVLHPPFTQGMVGYYSADTYDEASLKWPDHSTSNAAVHFTSRSSYATATTQASQIKPDAMSRYIVGPSSSVLLFPEPILPKEYTLFYIASYSGPARGRIINTLDNTWLSGFYSAMSGVSYRHDCDWITTRDRDIHGMSFFMASDRNNSFRSDAIDRVDYGGPKSLNDCENQGWFTGLTSRICINCQQGEWSDFAISLVLVYNYRLSDSEVLAIEFWMLNNFTSSLCSIGQHFSWKDQACVDCPLGSFKDNVGSSSCSPCPSGTTTLSVGSTAISACIAVPCPAGQEPAALMFCASSLSMTCPSGSVINVVAASYGMSAYQLIISECPMPARLVFQFSFRRDMDITGNLASCNGLNSCSPSLSVPDPAPGNPKGYYVLYSCTVSTVNAAALLCKQCSQDYYKSLVGSFACLPCAVGHSTLGATGSESCSLISPTPPVVGGLIGYYTPQSWGLGKPSGAVIQWTDLSAMRNHLTASTGTVTGNFRVVTSVGGPAYVAGGTSEQLRWPKSTSSFKGTHIFVARYDGPNRKSIISCSTPQRDLWGFYEGRSGTVHRCGNYGSPPTSDQSKDTFANNFLLQVITPEVTRINGRFW